MKFWKALLSLLKILFFIILALVIFGGGLITGASMADDGSLRMLVSSISRQIERNSFEIQKSREEIIDIVGSAPTIVLKIKQGHELIDAASIMGASITHNGLEIYCKDKTIVNPIGTIDELEQEVDRIGWSEKFYFFSSDMVNYFAIQKIVSENRSQNTNNYRTVLILNDAARITLPKEKKKKEHFFDAMKKAYGVQSWGSDHNYY